MTKKTEKEKYERWWKDKWVRVSPSAEPKFVISITIHGSSLLHKHRIRLHFSDGTLAWLKRDRPRLQDVEVLTNEEVQDYWKREREERLTHITRR